MIFKLGLLVSDFGLISLIFAQVVDPIKVGDELSRLTAAGILGVVSVVCILGLMTQYRDQRRHTEKLFSIIEANTKAHEVAATNAAHTAGILVEVKDAILLCKERGR